MFFTFLVMHFFIFIYQFSSCQKNRGKASVHVDYNNKNCGKKLSESIVGTLFFRSSLTFPAVFPIF
jgi:hypothetical protein